MIFTTDMVVLTSAIVSALLFLMYLYLYMSEKSQCILMWSFGCLLFTAMYISRYSILIDGETVLLCQVNYVASMAAYWMIFYGDLTFLEARCSKMWIAALTGCGLTFFVGTVAGLSSVFCSLPSVVLVASMMAYLGYLFFKLRYTSDTIRMVLGSLFMMWSLIVAAYPLFFILKKFPLTIGYIMVGIPGFVVCVCLQAAYFQKLKEKLQEREERIRYLKMYDKLTGIYNRSYFEEVLHELVSEDKLPVSVIMGDVNGLKIINDTFGHHKGDELLTDTVKILGESCRESDIIVRWGGDEFLVVMPETGYDTALSIAGKIKANCRNYIPSTIPVDISLGVAVRENTSQSFYNAIVEADAVMYRNKIIESRCIRKSIIAFLEHRLLEKDYQTEKHVKRLEGLVKQMGLFLQLSEKDMDALCSVAALHDIGKIGVPEEILKKPGKLTKSEWEIMKRHSEIGYRIAQSTQELTHISECILYHHEWWNGGGYPQGIKGEDIPLFSRIISIADTYDVMTHERPYKSANSKEEALREINRCAGTQFDPYLAKVFTDMLTFK